MRTPHFTLHQNSPDEEGIHILRESDGVIVCEQLIPEHAEFIVRACNSHDDLLKFAEDHALGVIAGLRRVLAMRNGIEAAQDLLSMFEMNANAVIAKASQPISQS